MYLRGGDVHVNSCGHVSWNVSWNVVYVFLYSDCCHEYNNLPSHSSVLVNLFC